jgi:hypothetical protein
VALDQKPWYSCRLLLLTILHSIHQASTTLFPPFPSLNPRVGLLQMIKIKKQRYAAAITGAEQIF